MSKKSIELAMRLEYWLDCLPFSYRLFSLISFCDYHNFRLLVTKNNRPSISFDNFPFQENMIELY